MECYDLCCSSTDEGRIRCTSTNEQWRNYLEERDHVPYIIREAPMGNNSAVKMITVEKDLTKFGCYAYASRHQSKVMPYNTLFAERVENIKTQTPKAQ